MDHEEASGFVWTEISVYTDGMKRTVLPKILILLIVSTGFAADGPDFTGQILDVSFNDLLSGNEFTTADPDTGRIGTLIVFWSTKCGPCLSEIPELNALYTEWGPQGLEIVGFPQDLRPEDVIIISGRFGISWPQNMESGWPFEKPTAVAWLIDHTPSFMLLDSSGVILEDGFSNPAEVIEKYFHR